MKLRHFHILLILLFALILCPLLGGYCGPEGLTNIEQHLKDSHGVSVSSTSNSETSSSSNSEAAQEENAKLKERFDNLDITDPMVLVCNNASTSGVLVGVNFDKVDGVLLVGENLRADRVVNV